MVDDSSDFRLVPGPQSSPVHLLLIFTIIFLAFLFSGSSGFNAESRLIRGNRFLY